MPLLALAVSLCFAGLTVLCLPRPAYAQEPAVSVGVAYQHLRIEDASWPRGLSGDIVVHLSTRWAVVAEADRSSLKGQGFGFDQQVGALAVNGGVRWTGAATARLHPYAQLLVGAQRDTIKIDRFGSDAQTHFAVRPGGGIALLHLAWRLAPFAQVDWRHVRRDAKDRDALQLLVGSRLTLR